MDLVLTLLACSVLLVAPPELDTVQSCMSVVSCAPTQHDQLARFYLRADAVDQSGNVSLLSVLSAQVEFDIADVACWRRLLAGKTCPIAPVEMSAWDWEHGPFSFTVREELAGLGDVLQPVDEVTPPAEKPR